MRIAFLGTGRMGTELALHLVKGHELTVWNRTPGCCVPLVARGAVHASDVDEVFARLEQALPAATA